MHGTLDHILGQLDAACCWWNLQMQDEPHLEYICVAVSKENKQYRCTAGSRNEAALGVLNQIEKGV